MASQSTANRDAESQCLTCAATGLANDFGLCTSCGATRDGDVVGGFRGTVVLPVRGLGGALRVSPASLLSAPKLLHHGRALKRERGAFRVATESQGTLEIRVKPRFVDPYPQVRVNGVELRYGDPLPWYATLLAYLPTLFMVGGGCMGIAFGAMASGASIKALRWGKSDFSRYGVPLIFNGVTLVIGTVLFLMKLASFAPPAVDNATQTVTSLTGLSRMSIPAAWRPMPALAADAELAYGSESLDEYVLAFAEPVYTLDEGVTLRDYAELVRPELEGGVYGALAPMMIAERDALQRQISGRVDGVAIAYLQTVVDMGTHFYQVCVWTSLANFARRQEAYARVTSSLASPPLQAAAELAAGGDAFPLTAMRRANPSTHHTSVERTPIPEPPRGVFELVRYRAPLGENAAYITPVSAGERKPAILWLVGGFSWGVWEGAWEPAPRTNDQSARAFRSAGMVMMLPALRGSHDSAGERECYHGEVDDVLAAVEYLKTRPDVDPQRIFLGGHSSGATLALLAAASTDAFRGVVAFGPAPDPRWYGDRSCLSSELDEAQLALRAPVNFMRFIRSPTFLIEGGDGSSLEVLQHHAGSAPIQSFVIPNANHFDVLAPGTEAAAEWMTGEDLTTGITFAAITSRLAAAAPAP